ncbi:hypothetical protein ACIBBE_09705 [Streptomyces sp. NPDC051644]|uniref:hypothetical protein n=1 Tax=Streptomyces sp. NPDC051644 TaxID=3365666 RepID=UPI0037A18204
MGRDRARTATTGPYGDAHPRTAATGSVGLTVGLSYGDAPFRTAATGPVRRRPGRTAMLILVRPRPAL